MGRIFSRTYNACIQSKIEQHISKRELEEALTLLDDLKPDQDPRFEIDRLVIQREGYKAVAYEAIEYQKEHNFNNDIDELTERFPPR